MTPIQSSSIGSNSISSRIYDWCSRHYADHIRLTGEVEAADSVVLWLTRRLLDRLIPHLTLWLEKQQGDISRPDLLLSFAQQAAQSGVTPQAPVPAWATSRQWLVQSVDLQPGEELLQLVFKGEAGQSASIGFAATPLRQWLGILHQGYRVAQWPQTQWPGWMTEGSSPNVTQAVVLH